LSRFVGELSGFVAFWVLGGGIIIHARPAWIWFRENWALHPDGQWFAVVVGAGLVGFVVGVASRRRDPELKMSAENEPRRLTMIFLSWIGVLICLFALTILYQNALIAFGSPSEASWGASYEKILSRNLSELASGLSFNTDSLATGSTLWRLPPSVTLCVALVMLACVASWRLDVNTFSIQNLYRNRLVRCYLGAANHAKRFKNPYAGFDPRDDFELADLAEQRPYLLINAALNLTQGQDLASAWPVISRTKSNVWASKLRPPSCANLRATASPNASYEH